MNDSIKKLALRFYPDPILRKKGKDIDPHDPETRMFLDDFVPKFIETMTKEHGIGLAAPQVGLSLNIIAIKVSTETKAEVFINPQITFASKKRTLFLEGCLSIPEVFGYVERPEKIRIKYLDIHGNVIKRKLNSIESRVVQHEIDHINGILFIDTVTEFSPGSKEKFLAMKKHSL